MAEPLTIQIVQGDVEAYRYVFYSDIERRHVYDLSGVQEVEFRAWRDDEFEIVKTLSGGDIVLEAVTDETSGLPVQGAVFVQFTSAETRLFPIEFLSRSTLKATWPGPDGGPHTLDRSYIQAKWG